MKLHVTITPQNIREFPMHAHDTWEYIYYQQGTGVLKTTKKEVPFYEGTFIAVPKGMSHGSRSNQPFRNICIHTDFCIFETQELHAFQATKEIGDIFQLILHLYADKIDRLSAIQPLLIALKELMVFNNDEQTKNTISAVKNEIVKGFRDPDFDLKALIDRSGYVDDFFRVKFKARYGVTPKQYLNDLRMHSAKDSLRVYGGVLSIKEISETCGFYDPLYFSRKFKKYFGVSPKEYAKNKEHISL